MIDKLAVDVNVFRAGKFKSFTDQFSRSDMSEQEEQESMAWLNALWTHYQAGVTKARGLDAGAIAAYSNEYARDREGSSRRSRDRGAGEKSRDRAEVAPRVRGADQSDWSAKTRTSIRSRASCIGTISPRFAPRDALKIEGDHIGVVVASGEILDGAQPPGTIGSDSTSRLLREALHDEKSKPWCCESTAPAAACWRRKSFVVRSTRLREAGKPVIASMSSMAASGGYYIAMDADEIWASPATLTGSIGVFAVFPTIERTLEKFGVTIDGVGTTPYAGLTALDRTLNDGAKEILQNSINHAYSVFVEQRGDRARKIIRRNRCSRAGQGVGRRRRGSERPGRQIGFVRDALDSAAERASLGKDYKVHYIEPPMGWRQALAMRSQALAARVTRALVPEQRDVCQRSAILAPLEAELTRLARFSDPQQVYYYCPCSAP